mgnify:FL=1
MNESGKEDLHPLWMPCIRSLDLCGENFKNGSVKTLTQNQSTIASDGLMLASGIKMMTIWTNLQKLNLSSNNIDEKGTEHLSNNQTWTQL